MAMVTEFLNLLAFSIKGKKKATKIEKSNPTENTNKKNRWNIYVEDHGMVLSLHGK